MNLGKFVIDLQYKQVCRPTHFAGGFHRSKTKYKKTTGR